MITAKQAKVYLSGPITGVPNYMETFNRAHEKIAKAGYRVINPANLIYVMDEGATWEDFMKIDTELLHQCDVLVQLPGWEKSLGCQREYGMALERDMLIFTYDDFMRV